MRLTHHALLFLVLLCLAQCRLRTAPSEVEIAGGQLVDESHWLAKSVAFLGSNCSGVIISPYHVLTALARPRDFVLNPA